MYLRGFSGLSGCAQSWSYNSTYGTADQAACAALGGHIAVENGQTVCRIPQKCSPDSVAAAPVISINNANTSNNVNANTVSPTIQTTVATQVSPTFNQSQVAPQSTNTTQAATVQPRQSTVIPAQSTAATNLQQNIAQYQDYVSSLYRSYLGRAPSSQELSFWAGQIAQSSMSSVNSQIASSAEAQAYRQQQAAASAANTAATREAADARARQLAEQRAASDAAARAAAAQGASPAQQQAAGQQAAQSVASNQAPVVDAPAAQTYAQPASGGGGGGTQVIEVPGATVGDSGMNPLVWVALAAVGVLAMNNNHRR